MAMTTVSTKIDEEHAGRVDLVVRDLSNASRSQVRGMVDHGCVSINGKPCSSIGATVSVGDEVTLRYDLHQRYHEKKKTWDDRTFTVAYEDDYLIVVDKSAGSLTVPTDNNDDRNTLVERVSIYLSHSRKKRPACVVHRLDREVSGLLVFAKQQDIADALIQQFKQRKPQRLYAAIVAGLLPQDEATFRSHLATGNNLDRYVAPPSEKSELAITHYRVVDRMLDTTLVEVQLETGKRNQIRVHFADAGHPVLGDPRYRKETAKHPRWIRKRIALHAKSLGFVHPATGETLEIESPLPSAMDKFIASQRQR
ncbi:Ribosomal large subunit pseudouridine synthase D [Rosistilla carotiformis]|uniref:Pseudouridine synthase n=1 Tax=Rosistilla carotiformis TaxID=2528017 RepID=A0A518JSF8_9BACT|nr:RluA family pseudouridine synthase [Rosistilla carotiformis]QDV68482.1 Ribosomal large subunit pseudouridine synthase D [Rosistilla carotiformis]